MELLYIWIEDYKNIKKQGFNFSPKHWFNFEYKEDENKKVTGGTLKHEDRNLNYPEDFFGENISNVTAIIGKNGSGKSNLMEFLIRFCASSHGLKEYNKNIIFIYIKAGKLYTNRPKIKCNYELHEKEYIQYPLNDYAKSVNTRLIYYSPHTEKFILKGLGEGLLVDDISNGGILRDNLMRKNNEPNYHTDIELLQMEDSLRHIQLFKYLLKSEPISNTSTPKAIDLQINALSEYNQEIRDENYQRLFNKNDDLSFIQHIENRLLNQVFTIDSSPSNMIYNSFEEMIKTHYSYSFYKELLKLHNEGSIEYDKDPYSLGPFNFVFIFKIRTENLSDSFMKSLYYYYFKHEVYYGLTTLDFNRNLTNDISWEWIGISSGEMSFYNFYGRLLEKISSCQHINSRVKNIILFLDEPETSFHPEWQRKFIKESISFIKKIIGNINIQILISSHSPFLVSDLPKENLVFLDKDKNTGDCIVSQPENMSSTFGANIHSLYRNSFFLENGLMGEFAKKKIDDVIKDLNQDDPKDKIDEIRKKEMNFIIDQIGEPIIKSKLQQMYDEKFHSPQQIDNRIKALEEEIKQLKGKQV